MLPAGLKLRCLNIKLLSTDLAVFMQIVNLHTKHLSGDGRNLKKVFFEVEKLKYGYKENGQNAMEIDLKNSS